MLHISKYLSLVGYAFFLLLSIHQNYMHCSWILHVIWLFHSNSDVGVRRVSVWRCDVITTDYCAGWLALATKQTWKPMPAETISKNLGRVIAKAWRLIPLCYILQRVGSKHGMHWHWQIAKRIPWYGLEVDQAVAKKESHHCGDSEGMRAEFCWRGQPTWQHRYRIHTSMLMTTACHGNNFVHW